MKSLLLLVLLALTTPEAFAQTSTGQPGGGTPPSAPPPTNPPGTGPALGPDRITQEDILSGALTLAQIRAAGGRMFTTPFNKFDGHGDGPMNPLDPTTPGGRPTLQNNGTFLRVNGLDSQTCLECHFINSNRTVPATLGIGGIGGIAASAMPGPRNIDVDDEAGNGFAAYDGRLINPPFLFGAGGVEMVGKEMTAGLQALKAQAHATPGAVVPLVVKGVDFGTISYDDGTDTFDTSNVVGVNPDLVVRPFGRKGEFQSVRAFDIEALQFHLGMQAVEKVGENFDADGDGVMNEVLVGELSSMHVFGTMMERPRQIHPNHPRVRRGEDAFIEAGCAACHVPAMNTTTRYLPMAFPEDPEDPWAHVFLEIDLADNAPGFDPNSRGGVVVPMFSDLKRHDLGPALAETAGSVLDPWFITARLWGVADTAPYLHDGRALTITDAILAHAGEAQSARDAFVAFSEQKQTDVLIFLDSLRVPNSPNQGVFNGNGHGN